MEKGKLRRGKRGKYRFRERQHEKNQGQGMTAE
jgi:hypothetical protein